MTETRVYIAGPMRGHPEYNFPAFDRAALQLKALGYDQIQNPAQNDRATGFNEQGLTGHEDLTKHGFDLHQAIRRDLLIITGWATHIAMLCGWTSSPGARLELRVAMACGVIRLDLQPDGSTIEYPIGAPT